MGKNVFGIERLVDEWTVPFIVPLLPTLIWRVDYVQYLKSGLLRFFSRKEEDSKEIVEDNRTEKKREFQRAGLEGPGVTWPDWRQLAAHSDHSSQNHRVGLAVTQVPAHLGNNMAQIVSLASGPRSPGFQPTIYHWERCTPGVTLTALTDIMTAVKENGSQS